ncbi:hypothetical protein [Nocardia sp. NPDC127526]|uniref:hypothetical protein n=1 Tax=Nocardia sp. NPDC127526 TaxID=3345393 RepID=UPI00362D59D3
MAILNIHSRILPAAADKVADIVETFGSGEHDRIWPGAPWPVLALDGPIAIGTHGSHGGGHYTVVGHQPGRWVRFRFEPGVGEGFHEFTIEPLGDETTKLSHITVMRLGGPAKLMWPLMIRSLHNDCLESLLDRVERELTGTVRTPHRPDPYARFLLRMGVMR